MDDLTAKIEKARKLGVPDDVIQQRIEERVQSGKLKLPASKLEPKKKGLVGSLIEGLTKPAIDYAKLLGGGFVQAPILAATQGKLNIPILSEEELQKYQEKPLETGAKATAGALSYAIPGGGASKLARAGLGAVAGGLYGYSQDQDIASSAAMGGVGGVVIPELLNVGGKLLGGLGKTGTAMRQSVINPQVPIGPIAPQQEATIVENLTNIGKKYGVEITGSAKSMRDKVNTVRNIIVKNVDDVLGKSDKGQGINKVTSLIKKELETNGEYFIPGDTTYEKLLGRELELLKRDAIGGRLTTKQLFNFKNKLADKLNNAFRKESGELQSALTVPEEVRRDIWNVVDNVITTLEPGVKDLTKELSTLHKASPGIAKSMKQTMPIPFTGMRVGTGGIQSMKEGVGRVLEKAGGISNLPSGLQDFLSQRVFPKLEGVSPMIQKAVTSPMISELMGRGLVLPRGGAESMGLDTGGLETPTVPTTPTTPQVETTPSDQLLTKEEAMMLMLKYPKQQALIKTLYDMGSKEKTLGTAEKKRVAALNQVAPVIQRLQTYAYAAPTGLKGELASQFGRLPGVSGGSAEMLRRDTKGFARLIASALASEVGVATDQDVERWLDLMPKPSDTMEEREDRLNNIIQQIQTEASNYGVSFNF